MALTFNKNTGNKKVPIKRNTKFFGVEDFDLELEFAKEYLEQDANQTIILYRVDLSKTKVNDVYKEAQKDAIRFLPPIELPVIYEIDEAELKSYGLDGLECYHSNQTPEQMKRFKEIEEQ